MAYSEIDLTYVLFNSNILHEYGCCKLVVNDEVVWDDDVEMDEYIKFEDALNMYKDSHPNWEDYRVVDIDIQIVHIHHSIISIYCE